MDVCTIIAKNYLAQARVLAQSFAEHHPQGRCSVLVIDDFEGYIDVAEEPFDVLTPAQIGCEEFEEMALRYDVLELSTAVKPWLLSHLLQAGAPAITYLDPDIRVYSSLQSLDELAREREVVLTPHNTVPLPDDGKRPNQIDILLAGVYNLGYVSLGGGDATEALLRWWRERLLVDCRVDPLNGYFVDQRWFDLAPGLVPDHAVVRDPQYNLAYWNLHCRELAHDGRSYTADGRELAFFHFSGFDPDKPDVLSRHQSRVRVEPDSALARICREYAEEVKAAGYQLAKTWPYTYHLLPSGLRFTRSLRRLYEIAQENGEVHGSPFAQSGEESFLRWLAAPAPAAPLGVNRLLAEMYGTRADLQEAFPDVAGGDHAAFLKWARDTGVTEEPMLKRLWELQGDDAAADEASAPPPDAPVESPPHAAAAVAEPEPRAMPWGVNVVGYFRSELGVGEAARQVVSALDARGVPVLPVHGRTIPLNRQGHAYTHLDFTDARYPVNLICMNADALGEFAAQAGPEFFAGRYSIGMWFWEVELFLDRWKGAFEHVDELWLPTDHVIKAVSPLSTVPIVKITLPVEMPPLFPVTRSELGLPEGFMFLFSFDYHSVFERKNPLAIVEAYRRSFKPDDGTVLVLKSINSASAPEAHARLRAASADRSDIHIIDSYVSPEHKNLMLAACDCYVSLHRAEGFGLTMAEAMYLEKPVIATGYSGNLDFMNDRNSFLVEHTLVAIGEDAAPYPPEGVWAQPDVQHAARLMREVFAEPERAAARARQAAEDIRRTHSAGAAGEIMGRRLDVLRERHAGQLASARRTQPASALIERAKAGPTAVERTLPRRAARRLLLRAIKPFSAYQKGVNEDLARKLASLDAKVEDLGVEAVERQSALLAGERGNAATRGLWERSVGLTRSVVALESAVAELQRIAGELPEVPQRLNELGAALQRLEWESRAIPYMEGEPFTEFEHPPVGTVQGYRASATSDADDVYRSFEDTFRGSERFIRERQRVYLPLLEGVAPVLDLGCGRGEFLDLLAERGIQSVGVDSDEGMVRRCREHGHENVVHDDALHYLQTVEDGSLGAVFCAQVIEHLPYESLLRLFGLVRRKLAGDGIFIAETVNPHAAAALKTFWVDLTHQHPIFPEVALSLARLCGFSDAFIFHPNGAGDVERDRFSQGEYALVAGGASLLGAREAVDAIESSARVG